MSKADPEIHTVSDLRKALRNGDPTLRFRNMADVNAWDTIEKHAGRTTGERLTEQALRRLEILVADHFDLRMYILTRKPLPEFADLCDRALGGREAGAKRPVDLHHDGQRAAADTDESRHGTKARRCGRMV